MQGFELLVYSGVLFLSISFGKSMGRFGDYFIRVPPLKFYITKRYLAAGEYVHLVFGVELAGQEIGEVVGVQDPDHLLLRSINQSINQSIN